jgi:hypothetical protein
LRKSHPRIRCRENPSDRRKRFLRRLPSRIVGPGVQHARRRVCDQPKHDRNMAPPGAMTVEPLWGPNRGLEVRRCEDGKI